MILMCTALEVGLSGALGPLFWMKKSVEVGLQSKSRSFRQVELRNSYRPGCHGVLKEAYGELVIISLLFAPSITFLGVNDQF